MIKVFCFNKNDSSYGPIIDMYINKIKRFTKIELIIIEEFATNDIKRNTNVNDEALLKKISQLNLNNTYLLEINGKELNSLEFSNIINEKIVINPSELIFIIGPSDGFGDVIKKTVHNKLSFGRITLPHLLCRTVLLEQIYRSFKIINNQKYHK